MSLQRSFHSPALSILKISVQDLSESGTAGFHSATVLCAPKAMRPDTRLLSAALGVRLLPMEMKDGCVDSEGIVLDDARCHSEDFEN
jgi:hypothetical protein